MVLNIRRTWMRSGTISIIMITRRQCFTSSTSILNIFPGLDLLTPVVLLHLPFTLGSVGRRLSTHNHPPPTASRRWWHCSTPSAAEQLRFGKWETDSPRSSPTPSVHCCPHPSVQQHTLFICSAFLLLCTIFSLPSAEKEKCSTHHQMRTGDATSTCILLY